jgi:aldehyde:ferredoxin oxidoreductase
VEEQSFSEYRDSIGGRGVNQRILFQEMPVGLDAFDPQNPLAIGAGFLAGTDAPGACRLNIDGKNALTDGIGSGNCGGTAAVAMRRAGVTNIVIYGSCPEPSCLLVRDGAVDIIPVPQLKGEGVGRTTAALTQSYPGASVLAIGPAGENLVRSAAIFADGARAVGRCGLGAVMGSKGLKAVAVQGSGTLEVADPEGFAESVRRCTERLAANAFNRKRMHYGVYCYDEPWDIESPYRNFSGDVPPRQLKEQLGRDRFAEYQVGERSCPSCPIRCWKIYEVPRGEETVQVEALQGNDPHNFGAKLGIDRASEVLYAHGLCTELGLDVDNASGAVAWAIDCFEQGLIDSTTTDGQQLRWADAAGVFELLEKIAHRRGFGDVLADGSLRAARIIGGGTEQRVVHVKGQDLFECLWSSPSWALGTLVSPRGGGHTRGAVLEGRFQNLDARLCKKYFGIPALEGIHSYENKEHLVVFFERLEAFLDCVGICLFTNSLRMDMLLPEHYADLYSRATGRELSAEQLIQAGERAHTVERAFNCLHTDWGRAEDRPPKRFTEVALNGRHRLDPQAWERLLDRYYELHGWDSEGMPEKDTLARLGLEEIGIRLYEDR